MFYIFDENKNIVSVDVKEWARFFEKADRRVRKTYLKKYGIVISTVFMGIDQSIGIGKDHFPYIFETMVFWPNNQEMDSQEMDSRELYSTWTQAVKGHRRITRMVIAQLRELNKIR